MRRSRKVAKTTENYVPTILPDIPKKTEEVIVVPKATHYSHNEDPEMTKQEFFENPPDSFEWVDEYGVKVTGRLLEITDNLIRYLIETNDNRWNITCIFKKKTSQSEAISSIRELPHWRVIPIDVSRINCDLLVSIEADFAVFAFKYCFGLEVCTEDW